MLDPISRVISATHTGEAEAAVGIVKQEQAAAQEAAAAPDGAAAAEAVDAEKLEAAEAAPRGKRRGPKVKLNEFEKGRICGLIGAGLSQRQAALYLGFSPSAVSKALRRDPKFAVDVARAAVSAKFQPLYKVIQASSRSWRAAVWLYENAQPHTDLAERDARRAARKAEQQALRQAERERELRRQRQQESDEEFRSTCDRLTKGLREPETARRSV